MSKEIMDALQMPFRSDEIEWRVGATNQDKTKGIALAYVTNRAIQNRLDETFGPFGWRNEYKEWKGTSQLCGISVKHEGEWITKWDGAEDSDMESVKGGLSDSMKRAAYQWGIGRYLYLLPNTWVALAPAGRSYRLAETPQLPTWALPESERATTSPAKQQSVAKHPPQAKNPAEPKPGPSAPKTHSDEGSYCCSECAVDIPQGVSVFSIKKFGKPLCMKCQKEVK